MGPWELLGEGPILLVPTGYQIHILTIELTTKPMVQCMYKLLEDSTPLQQCHPQAIALTTHLPGHSTILLG